uniref:Sodium/calcium exchanger membrane region domain-containing protein n=1 Tax=Hyaloperonospora arabidopsidis (strain Emoy2) TaxID=559515 RepID=M4B2F5_HYAAE
MGYKRTLSTKKTNTNLPYKILGMLPAACDDTPFVANMTLGPLAIDYVHIHYCYLSDLPFLSFILLIVWLAALFYFLGSTADGYFSPTLASLSDRLRLPHDVAGVTFLAFGNGAPDVFSAIAAFSSGVRETGVNELLGGAMFISTVVVGGVAMTSAVEVQRGAFLRDVGALVASLLLFLLLAVRSNRDDMWSTAVSAVTLLALYGIYVGSVVISAFVARYNAARDTGGSAKMAGGSSLMIAAFWHALSPRGNDAKGVKRSRQREHNYAFVMGSEADTDVENTADRDGEGMQQELKKSGVSPIRELAGPRFSSRVYNDHFDVEENDTLSSPLIAKSKRDTDNESKQVLPKWQQHMRLRWRLKRRVIRIFTSNEPFVMKVLCIPQAALVLLRDVTIPLFDESWSCSKACLSPITVPLLVAATSGYTKIDISGGRFSYRVLLWQVLVIVGGFVSGIIALYTHRSHAPRSFKLSSLLLSLAFVACVCWIYAVANELMALLAAVGYITHISNSLLGLTVLAWGNSVGDLITDVSVARAGFSQMAIAGCFAGPVFNILLGLGLPMVLAFVSGRSEVLSLDAHARISLVFLFVSLTSTLVVFGHYKYHCPAWYGKLLIAYYCIYSLLNLVVALRVGPM